ncbi:MAG: Uma2 family endonuclease [Saprospiraceae bacterium]|nr:Uma2 family endonuclease [Saprospiraceae bacterium]
MTAIPAPALDFSNIQIKIRPGQVLYLPGQAMSQKEFYEFCLQNADLRIERDANGQIEIMPPTTSETGQFNAELSGELFLWNRQTKLGKVFDSSTGFTLPNGAERSPDAAWIRNERWEALAATDRQTFAPITPDFVMELRSAHQSLSALREKMDEYMAHGCRLGWLIDPQHRRTYVYAENGDIQTIGFDTPLSGGEVLPGFVLRLGEIG